MKNKTVIILLSTTLFFSFIPQNNDVYICNGPSSKRYHFIKNCRGLSNCSKEISKVSLSEAKKIGRTLCGWED